MNLENDIAFIDYLDKLKSVYRKALVKNDNNRFENSAEHSWHAMMTAYTLQHYFDNLEFDINKAINMLLIHDIVEINAGDTFAYDSNEILSQQKNNENSAAKHIFSLPNNIISKELFILWNEFNEQKTGTSIFANAIDKLTSFILNVNNNGGTWKNHVISADKVRLRNENLKLIAPRLWEYLNEEISKAIYQGLLSE